LRENFLLFFYQLAMSLQDLDATISFQNLILKLQSFWASKGCTLLPLGDFLNPALALLGQGLKKSPIGQKLDFANHPYLCKGLNLMIFNL
jgi:hypothetical protein